VTVVSLSVTRGLLTNMFRPGVKTLQCRVQVADLFI